MSHKAVTPPNGRKDLEMEAPETPESGVENRSG